MFKEWLPAGTKNSGGGGVLFLPVLPDARIN